jgi:hypothetical protein
MYEVKPFLRNDPEKSFAKYGITSGYISHDSRRPLQSGTGMVHNHMIGNTDRENSDITIGCQKM